MTIYDSFDFSSTHPWARPAGSSELSASCWAGLIAIADQLRGNAGMLPLDGPSQTLPLLYNLPASYFNDVTDGNNGNPAGPGYDLITGRGTPKNRQSGRERPGALAHLTGPLHRMPEISIPAMSAIPIRLPSPTRACGSRPAW